MVGNDRPRLAPPLSLRPSKRPLIGAWQRNAARDDYSDWPLVGVPTGEANGFDVLDIDLDGTAWWDAHRAELPTTQIHTTRSGGAHLLFKHAEGLRCSVGRIATGVDVRADGGFIVWWPRQGLRVIQAELGEWPEWLLEKARKRELAQPEEEGPCQSFAPHGAAHGGPTLNVRARSYGLVHKVAHAIKKTRNDTLNWASYQFGRMIGEGVIQRDVAEQLLRGAAQACGLWREDGAVQCMATIKSGLDAGIKAYVPQAGEDGGDRYLHGPSSYRGTSNPSDHLWQSDELPSSISAASSTANVE